MPLETGLARANADEYVLLGVAPDTRVYVREVLLLCNEVTVVFAHSLLPSAGLRGGWNGITQLGSRSLGEAADSGEAGPRFRLMPGHRSGACRAGGRETGNALRRGSPPWNSTVSE